MCKKVRCPECFFYSDTGFCNHVMEPDAPGCRYFETHEERRVSQIVHTSVYDAGFSIISADLPTLQRALEWMRINNDGRITLRRKIEARIKKLNKNVSQKQG